MSNLADIQRKRVKTLFFQRQNYFWPKLGKTKNIQILKWQIRQFKKILSLDDERLRSCFIADAKSVWIVYKM